MRRFLSNGKKQKTKKQRKEKTKQNERLLSACRTGNLDGVTRALKYGAFESLYKCLGCVCSGTGSLVVAQKLVDLGGEFGFDHFRHACKQGHWDLIKLIISICGFEYIYAGFWGACQGGQMDVIEYLMKIGQENNINLFGNFKKLPVFFEKCQGRNVDIIRFWLRSNMVNWTHNALFVSCGNDNIDLDTVQMIIDAIRKQKNDFHWSVIFQRLYWDEKVTKQRKSDVAFLFLKNNAPWIGIETYTVIEWLNRGVEHNIVAHHMVQTWCLDSFVQNRNKFQQYVLSTSKFISHVNVCPMFQSFVLPCVSFK